MIFLVSSFSFFVHVSSFPRALWINDSFFFLLTGESLSSCATARAINPRLIISHIIFLRPSRETVSSTYTFVACLWRFFPGRGMKCGSQLDPPSAPICGTAGQAQIITKLLFLYSRVTSCGALGHRHGRIDDVQGRGFVQTQANLDA